MPPSTYRGRRGFTIENADIRLTILIEGGHIAEIFDKHTEVNPLWTPAWPSVEPSSFGPAHHETFGRGADGPLLAGIMGHNLCLDLFGGPSPEEFAAGLTVHGEASVARYDIDGGGDALVARATFPLAGLGFERRIELRRRLVRINERVENLSAHDRPIAWTQHVTLGPPFLEKGITTFRASATRSKVFETTFGAADYLRPGATFDWPRAPRLDGGTDDLRRFTSAPISSAYTAHLMDPLRPTAFFVAHAPSAGLAFGYAWRRSDFPWMGIWEENGSRSGSPWNGVSLARGMEFDVSPMPETRRAMVDRGALFDVRTYRWIPALSALAVEYWAVLQSAEAVPESLEWPAS